MMQIKGKMKLRVLIGPVSWTGGVKTHIQNLNKYSNHQITLLNYSKYSLYYPKYRLSRFLNQNKKISSLDLYSWYFRSNILPNYDILHTHGHPVWQSIYKSTNKNLKYIHTIHQIYCKNNENLSKNEWKTFELKNNLMFNYCRNENVTTIAVSEYLKDILLEYDVNAEVIPNGINFEELEKGSSERFRKKYDIDDDFYLFIGHLGNIKRPEVFIELAKKIPDRKFVMIGPDISIESIALKYKVSIPDNLKVLGKVSRNNVLDALNTCTVYIQPSICESFSISLLEALACKKPAVSTDSCGPSYLKRSGVPLILFEPYNFEDLVEKANYAWERPNIGKKGYNIVKKGYDWNVVIKKIDQLYEQIVQ